MQEVRSRASSRVRNRRSRPWSTRSRRCRLLALLCSAGFLGSGLSFATAWLWWLDDPPSSSLSNGPNALWARHAWVGEPHSDEQYRALGRRLTDGRISDVFFHAGPLEADGTVAPDRYRYAEELLAAVRRYAPGLRAQAYLGQVERRGGGPLDLGNSVTRANVVTTAEQLLEKSFDGIHYDIEPIYPGDEDFLDLLDATRRLTRRHGAVLSVALEQLEFLPGTQRVVSRLFSRYHDPTLGYLNAVADRVDQVAVMTYDTGLPLDWLYGVHSAWQTCRVGNAIADRVTVFMGVPTYEEGHPWGFHPSAENVRSGVRGVRKGTRCLDGRQLRNLGIALFAEWTTDDQEWAAYHRAWIAHGSE